MWDASTGKELDQLPHEGMVTYAAFSPDGTKVVTATNSPASNDGGMVRVWDIDGGTVQRISEFPTKDFVTFASFSPNGKMVVTFGFSKTARVWNVESGNEQFESCMRERSRQQRSASTAQKSLRHQRMG